MSVLTAVISFALFASSGIAFAKQDAAYSGERREPGATLSQSLPKPSRDRLRVIVRDRSYLDQALTSPKGPSGIRVRLVSRQIGDDLFALLAFDGANAIAAASEEDLRDLGLSIDQGWTLATAETRWLLPPIPTASQLNLSAMAFEDGGYQASLLFDLAAWSRLAEQVGPDLIMTVVSDESVFVAKLPDGPDLEGFKEVVARDCQQQKRCVSPHVYRFRGGRWVIAR
jgi:hypothetical protein